jgi:glutamate/tyrosine decarboxylase-like PLP-dependent enzyme
MASLATHPAPAPGRTDRAESGLLTARTADAYEELLGQVTHDVAERFRTVRAPSVGPDRRRLEQLVEAPDLDGPGVGDAAALEEADALYAGHAVWFHHPSYLAHLNCPVVLPAVAAEAMLAAINTSVDTYDQSLVATLMEQRLVRWTAGRIGFEAGDGVFTSGGTQSNLQALFLARSRAERAAGEDRSALLPRLRVLTTDAAHFSVSRSAALLGLPEDAVRAVPSDAEGRMDPAALAAALTALEAAGEQAMAVVATAGTTDRGTIDPLGEIAEAASEDAEPNQVDKSLQTTRRFDALKLWTTLRSLGPDAIGDMVDAVCDLATEVRELLAEDPDLHVLGTTDLSTVIFRFRPEGMDDARADELQPLIRRILFHSGRAMVARTTIDGTPWLKLTLLNPETTLLDVAAVLDLVRATGRGLLAGTRLAAAEGAR